MEWPKHYSPEVAPPAIIELTRQLVPLLIEGDHPALEALRQQFPRARLKHVELTGSGFYVDFELPPDVPLAEPADFAGGDAVIKLVGADIPAGCVLFVRGGRLATFEGYTYGDEWAAGAVIESVESVVPIYPG